MPTHSQTLYPNATSSGYAVTYYRQARAFCDAYAIRGTCLQEAATHFSGHIYKHICSHISISLYSLVWGSLRSPNYDHSFIEGLRVLTHRKYRCPHSRPHLIDHIFGTRITLILLFASLSIKNTIERLDLPKMKRSRLRSQKLWLAQLQTLATSFWSDG